MSESAEGGLKKFKVGWRGFLALLATILVIAVVAISSYGDFTHFAQNSEAITLMASAKAPLGEYFQQNEKWPEDLDKMVENTSGRFTKSVAITRGAGGAGEIELTATMRTEDVDRRVRGKTILMVSSDGGKTWTCKRGTMAEENLPASCRKK